MLKSELLDGGNIHGEVGSAIGKGHSAGDASPGVEHRGRNGRMIRLHALDKFLRGGVNIFRLEKNLRGAAPAGDDARNACPLAEILDVFLDLQRELVFILALLDVGAVQLLDVVVTKRGLHGLDA